MKISAILAWAILTASAGVVPCAANATRKPVVVDIKNASGQSVGTARIRFTSTRWQSVTGRILSQRDRISWEPQEATTIAERRPETFQTLNW
jgi:hypothetical protein